MRWFVGLLKVLAIVFMLGVLAAAGLVAGTVVSALVVGGGL